MQWGIAILGFLLALLPQTQPDPCAVASIKRLPYTGDLSWSPAAQAALVVERDSTGTWQTYRVDDLYSGVQVLLTPGTRHHTGADWSPDGKYFAEAVEWDSNSVAGHYLNKGLLQMNGFHTDLWIASADGASWWRLTDYEHSGQALGGMAPRYSPDGRLVLWSALLKPADSLHAFGVWQLWLGELVWSDDGTPSLVNSQDVTPAGASWVESHGFTPDGKRLLFTSDLGLTEQTGQDEWAMSLDTGELVNLTNSPDQWDEHIHYSPDGSKALWMSSAPYLWTLGDVGGLKTEVMLMDADGTNQRPVTHFGVWGYPESTLQKSLGVGLWKDGQHALVNQVLAGLSYPARRTWEVTFQGPCGGPV